MSLELSIRLCASSSALFVDFVPLRSPCAAPPASALRGVYALMRRLRGGRLGALGERRKALAQAFTAP